MPRSLRPVPLPLIDLGKAVASQLIVWHHLALYSPMRQVVEPLAPGLFSWLTESARLAVQLFLVMAGFLAARSLVPRTEERPRIQGSELGARLWQRVVRLGSPAVVAIVMAVALCALARQFSDDPAIPQTPGWRQLLANLLFLQDILGEEALSAGLWYVAIDLQLFALMLALLFCRQAVFRRGWPLQAFTVGLALMAVSLSLFWLNRVPALDMWAPYFVGSYGLGVLAFWLSALNPRSTARLLGTLGLAAGVMIAMWLEWRSRIALAGITALGLILLPQSRTLQDWARLSWVQWLSRCSYSVFLAHYPVIVLVGAMSQCLWPDSLALNLFSLFLAWGLSLIAGQLLHRTVERRQGRPGRAAVLAGRGPMASVNS